MATNNDYSKMSDKELIKEANQKMGELKSILREIRASLGRIEGSVK